MPPCGMWGGVKGTVRWDVPYLVTKDGVVELFFVLKKPGWGWRWAWGDFGGVEGRPLLL